MSDLANPIFQDENKAREWLEARVWANGRFCPHCGVVGQSTLMEGKTTRPGLYQCNGCRKPFSVTVGTLYERSHIPLNKWLLVTHLMMASKKGMSALQISRMIGLSYKSTWFMCHRIRESLRPVAGEPPMGGQNKVVEADETYVGGKAKNRKNVVPAKEAVFSLVERDGKVRSQHVCDVSAKTLRPILQQQLDKRTHVMTDDATVYPAVTGDFAGHTTVNHSAEEYVRMGGFAHTNTVENYFSILKRGIIGTYHHVSSTHLKRYLGEFDYRYNERSKLGVNDAQRMEKSIKGIVGKRMTYRRINGKSEAEAV